MCTTRAAPQLGRATVRRGSSGCTFNLVPGARVTRITESSVEYSLSDSDDKVEIRNAAAESVIVTLGLQANPALGASLESPNIKVLSAGDCTGVGYIEGAIHDGFKAALELENSAD